MATMSDDGDRVCPLCAEEMDLTDQQLKPCKCGYEICVWCWHHIIEMAEKEETDGRCPACRTPYDKEKIVGMAANCERLAVGMNSERRHKSQKAKPKASAETRKQLSTVRVIQRNLVYIIGLPANLCNENLLERKEFFGQYGKVLKVSISRSASSTNQQASNNNTVGVYITYAREEAAVRCIQAVHNFVLDGKPLRACFGTTKYCHAWLRNMICNNPDCLYLHDIGSQEDSFTKDEIISPAIRVPHISSNSSQRRAGSLLPPPADDLSSNGTTTGKHSMKNVLNQNTIGQAKTSSGSVGRPAVLPAAASWGSRSSNGSPCSQSSMKQIVESSLSSRSSVSTVMKQVSSAWNDDEHPSETEGRHILITNDTSSLSELQLPRAGVLCEHQSTVSDLAYVALPAGSCDPRGSAWDDDPVAGSKSPEESYDPQAIGSSKMMPSPGLSSADTEQKSSEIGLHSDSVLLEADHTAIVLPPSCPHSSVLEENMDSAFHACKKINAVNGTAIESFDSHSVASGTSGLTCKFTNIDQDVQNACSNLASGDIVRNTDQQRTSLPNLTHCSLLKNPASKSQQYDSVEVFGKSISTPSFSVHISSNSEALRKPSSWSSRLEQQICPATGNMMGDSSPDVTDLRQRLSDATNQRLCSSHIDHTFNEPSGGPSSTANCHGLSAHASSCGKSIVHTNNIMGYASVRQNGLKLPNGLYEGKLNNIYKPASNLEGTFISSDEGLIDRLDCVDRIGKDASVHTGESSIISDMFSLDFDPWDDALSLANNFSKLLGENDGNKCSVILNRQLNTQNSNQSRFSFARQENQDSFIESSISDIDLQTASSVKCSYGNDFQNISMVKGFPVNGMLKNSATVTSDKPAVVFSRAKMSAPPGFSVPSRAPPPGFSVQDRYDQNIEASSEIHGSDNSLFGNYYQVHPTGNSGDVEFIDPAILAVGKGLKPIGSSNASLGLTAFPAHFSSSDCHPRFQTLTHQAVSSQQNMRFPDHIKDSVLSLNNSYIASHLSAQNHSSLSPLAQLTFQQSRSSPVSHSHWDGWSNMQTSTAIGMTEILRNERFGLNNYYLGKGEHKFHIPSSGDIYGRAFGM